MDTSEPSNDQSSAIHNGGLIGTIVSGNTVTNLPGYDVQEHPNHVVPKDIPSRRMFTNCPSGNYLSFDGYIPDEKVTIEEKCSSSAKLPVTIPNLRAENTSQYKEQSIYMTKQLDFSPNDAILEKRIVETGMAAIGIVDNQLFTHPNNLQNFKTHDTSMAFLGISDSSLSASTNNSLQNSKMLDKATNFLRIGDGSASSGCNNNLQNTPRLPPCKVCGEGATGFHYGVNTCEACKGFFRRCLVRKKQYTKCTKTDKCGEGTRSMCVYCRLKRCHDMGMSVGGPRWTKSLSTSNR